MWVGLLVRFVILFYADAAAEHIGLAFLIEAEHVEDFSSVEAIFLAGKVFY